MARLRGHTTCLPAGRINVAGAALPWPSRVTGNYTNLQLLTLYSNTNLAVREKVAQSCSSSYDVALFDGPALGNPDARRATSEPDRVHGEPARIAVDHRAATQAQGVARDRPAR